MREGDVFEDAAFVGLSKNARRDPYRLALFGQHLDSDERPLVVLPIQGGTLIVTDRRLLELRAHLEVHGAWNVKEFQGYAVHRTIDRKTVQGISHSVRPVTDVSGYHRIEDKLVFTTEHGPEELLVSKRPEPTLPDEDFEILRSAVLGS